MTSSLSVTTQLTKDSKLEIVCTVVDGGTLPQDIFIYENNGTVSLGSYIGICNMAEYQRLQTFQGSAIPKFGNKFVKYTEGRVTLETTDDTSRVINHLTNTATFLSFELSNSAATTQIIPIP